jgi:hypothetical protein
MRPKGKKRQGATSVVPKKQNKKEGLQPLNLTTTFALSPRAPSKPPFLRLGRETTNPHQQPLKNDCARCLRPRPHARGLRSGGADLASGIQSRVFTESSPQSPLLRPQRLHRIHLRRPPRRNRRRKQSANHQPQRRQSHRPRIGSTHAIQKSMQQYKYQAYHHSCARCFVLYWILEGLIATVVFHCEVIAAFSRSSARLQTPGPFDLPCLPSQKSESPAGTVLPEGLPPPQLHLRR